MSKIGSSHLAAMGRLGLRELRGAMYPDSNMAQSPEYGAFGTMTPGEIADSRREGARDLEDERPQPSILDRKLEQTQSREDRSVERTQDRESIELDR